MPQLVSKKFVAIKTALNALDSALKRRNAEKEKRYATDIEYLDFKSMFREIMIATKEVLDIPGPKGDTPTDKELIALIKPLIPEPIKGNDGIDGVNGETPVKGIDYFDGIDGVDGKTPVKGIDYFDGKDGSPDTPEQIKAKLENLPEEKRLNIKILKGLEEFIINLIKKYMPQQTIKMSKLGGSGGGTLQPITITGTVNGINDTFTLDSAYSFIALYWDGTLQEPTTHYTKNGKTITFTAGNIPTSGNLHGFGQL